MNVRTVFLLACGIWLLAITPPTHAQSIRAETGGMAIGGSVSGSTINIGVAMEKVEELVRDRTRSLEELTASQRDNIALLREKLDINERQVRAALAIVGEANVPPERLAQKLLEIAERFKALQATAAAQPGDDPRITALKTEAKKAVNAGELERADTLLAEAATVQAHALDRPAVNAAETHAQRGAIALTRLRYAEAAKHFAAAAALFPPDSAHAERRIAYLDREADALYRQGHEFGDNSAMLRAIDRFKALLTLRLRDRVPLDWARTQNALGMVLGTLGEREGGTARLEEAIAAFRAALTETSRERAPLDWAATQNNLGSALATLGERESTTARLEEAISTYRAALTEWSRERVALEWAATQNNLGDALTMLGERESGTARLEEAVAALRAALTERTRERAPFEWAMTQNNLGNALRALGEREEGTARLEEAVAAYQAALMEFIRERVPLRWATTQNNLGAALQTLGSRESGTARLEEAVAAYRAALTERTRERTPLGWAVSTGNEGVALLLLAERTSDAGLLLEALERIRLSFETARDGGHTPFLAFLAAKLPKARALFERLSAERGSAIPVDRAGK